MMYSDAADMAASLILDLNESSGKVNRRFD
jgi:hypothetical protein